MKTHYIILASCYAKGTRIVIDALDEEGFLKNKKFLFDKFGNNLPISVHIIPTEEEDFHSVVLKDSYFDDVRVIRDIKKFADLVSLDRKLKGIDIALYILAKMKCSHFKLEKLTYLCYADYLCKYDAPMFQDTIYAYKYGPVVKSVLKKFKKYDLADSNDTNSIAFPMLQENFTKSKILNADDGLQIFNSITETLNLYGDFSAKNLIKITHKKNTPWEKSGKGEKRNQIITDEFIKHYHCNEI